MKRRRSARQAVSSLSLTEIIKYAVAACIAVFIIVMFAREGGSGKPFDEVKENILASVDFTDMHDAGDQGLKRAYGLNAADYEGVLMYTSDFSMQADEFLVVKVNDKKQLEEVESAIDKHLESRISDFEGYAPEQADKLNNARRLTKGRYVFLSVSPNAEANEEIFRKSL